MHFHEPFNRQGSPLPSIQCRRNRLDLMMISSVYLYYWRLGRISFPSLSHYTSLTRAPCHSDQFLRSPHLARPEDCLQRGCIAFLSPPHFVTSSYFVNTSVDSFYFLLLFHDWMDIVFLSICLNSGSEHLCRGCTALLRFRGRRNRRGRLFHSRFAAKSGPLGDIAL